VPDGNRAGRRRPTELPLSSGLSPRIRAWLRDPAAVPGPGGPLDDLDTLRADQAAIGGDFRRALRTLADEATDEAADEIVGETAGGKPPGEVRGDLPAAQYPDPVSDTVDTESTPESLPEPAQVPLRRPCHQLSRRVVTLWRWRTGAGWGLLLAAQLIALIFLRSTWQSAGLIATVAVGGVAVGAMPERRYRVHRWELTSDALYTLQGWPTLHWEIAPISRIQNVNTEHGPLERKLRLATLTVTTASAHGAIRIEGLDRDVAAELAAELTRVTHATPWDAT
jgi:membrane protein YdbS with pleckstrin-like domain